MPKFRWKLIKNRTLPITLTFFFLFMGMFGVYFAWAGQQASLAGHFQQGLNLQEQAYFWNLVCVIGMGKILAWFIARMYQPWGRYRIFHYLGIVYALFSLAMNLAFGGLSINIYTIIISYIVYLCFYAFYYRFHQPIKVKSKTNPKKIIKKQRDQKVGM